MDPQRLSAFLDFPWVLGRTPNSHPNIHIPVLEYRRSLFLQTDPSYMSIKQVITPCKTSNDDLRR